MAEPAPAPEPVLDEVEAQSACTRGLSNLRQQFVKKARNEFKKACEMDPKQPAYRMYLLWSEHRAANTDFNHASRRELKELAKSHLCMENHSAFAHYILGHLAMSDREERAAEKFFKKAVDQDPKNQDAQRHYRILLNRRQKR
jgi:Tfp pilus assembly protein PilF